MGTKRPTLFKYLSPARDVKSRAMLARTQASKLGENIMRVQVSVSVAFSYQLVMTVFWKP